MRRFVDVYRARRELTPAETAAALAAAVYLFAYTARCEHGYLGPPRAPTTRMRETLAGAADDLLGRA